MSSSSCHTMFEVSHQMKTTFPIIIISLHCCEKTWWCLVQSVGLLLNNENSRDRAVGGVSVLFLRAAKQSLERGEAFFPERIWQSDSSKAKTLIERRALMQVGRPWFYQKQEKRENRWSLPWPTAIIPQLRKKKKKKSWRGKKVCQSMPEKCSSTTAVSVSIIFKCVFRQNANLIERRHDCILSQ